MIQLFVKKHKAILALTLLYFLFRIPNLTLLPIFNDEAIYLDWGQRMTEGGGDLYFSLYDNKQPLLMWIFGISGRIFADPLFAGRIVSVMAGFATLFGIYLLAKRLFDQKVALLASGLYILIPIFVFFDRQALMESAVSSIGVWSVIALIELAQTKNVKFAYLLGIILGLGFFIKSSALLFLIAAAAILAFRKMGKFLGITVAVAAITNVLIFINPMFWSTLSKNHYIFPPGEIIKLAWLQNVLTNFEIIFLFLTPVVTVTALFGWFILFKKQNSPRVLLYFTVIVLAFETISANFTSQRYLISYLPLSVIFSSYFIFSLFKKRVIFYLLVLGSTIIPAILSLFLIIKPIDYLLFFDKISERSSVGEYIKGYTSGIGIKETVEYLKLQPEKKRFVGFAINAGNPESAMMVYFNNTRDFNVGYLDKNLFGNRLEGVECLKSPYKIYFVARGGQQAGLEKYFYKLKTFQNPYSQHSIGIYSIIDKCEGKHLNISPVKQ